MAQHKNSKSRVAIKILNKKQIESEYDNPTEPFQEITLLHALARAKCPHVLELIDYDDDQNFHYLVTRVYAGGNLSSYFKEQIYFFQDEVRAKQIVHDIAVGLSTLHKRNIVHRDIKMENILMSGKGPNASACIADFGLTHKLKS